MYVHVCIYAHIYIHQSHLYIYTDAYMQMNISLLSPAQPWYFWAGKVMRSDIFSDFASMGMHEDSLSSFCHLQVSSS